MIPRQRIATICKLAIPIAAALGSAMLMSVIDLAMVGRLGNNATGAMGLSVFSSGLILALVAGIEPAVQGIVARRRGQRAAEPGCLPLNTGLLLALAVGIPLTITCYLFTPFFFSLIASDPEVAKIGVPVLRTLSLAIIGAGMNNAFCGYWTGMEKTKMYMFITFLMQCTNVFLNYVLIFGHFGAPALGAWGSAIATALSLYAAVIMHAVIIFVRFRKEGFLSVKPQRSLVVQMLKLGLPATMQGFFFSAGWVVFLRLVGQVGTPELAAANVLVRVSIVLLLLANGLGMASATLVSKTVGEGDLAGAAQWGWDSAKLGIIVITLLGLPLLIFPRLFLSIFLSDPHTISIAVLPLRLMAATAGLGSLIYVFAFTLYSVGDGNRVVMISFGTQWIFFLPAVWFVGPHLHHGLLGISLVQMAYGGIGTLLITVIWTQGRWKRIQI